VRHLPGAALGARSLPIPRIALALRDWLLGHPPHLSAPDLAAALSHRLASRGSPSYPGT
jgi:hypothetical protein